MFSIESMICGYIMSIWESPSPADHLFCQQEIRNLYDTLAVAVKGSVTGDSTLATVGHFPRKIFAIFIKCGGTIICVVNGSHHYSADLPLEILCVLQFTK